MPCPAQSRLSSFRLVGLGLLLALGACKSSDAPANNSAPVESGSAGDVVLTIATAGGAAHRFTVELAVDEQAQERGLMGRKPLPDDRGMLFPFPYPKLASFWMKDTPSPLDLLFIRPDGTIAAVLQGKPNDLHPLSAGEGISAVLEIRQGRAEALGIKANDRVQWGDCAAPNPIGGAWRADRFCPQ